MQIMDKYTVDLDKVLNDFEYSELTDNFGTSKAYHAQGSSSYASSSKSKTGDAKHSITNVFHSLNEYLNTDISSNATKIQLDNKRNYFPTPNKSFLQTTNTTIADSSVDIDNKLKELELNVGINEEKSDLSHSKPINENSNHTDTLVDLKSVKLKLNVKDNEEKNNLPCNKPISDNDNDTGTLLDLTSEEINTNDNKELATEFINENKSRSNINNLLDLDNFEVSNTTVKEKGENSNVFNGQSLLNYTNIEDYLEIQPPINIIDVKEAEFAVASAKKDIQDNVEVKNVQSVVMNVKNDIQQDTEVKKINTIEENIENLKQEIGDSPNITNDIVIKTKLDKIEKETDGKPEEITKDVVSFDNTLDLDEIALNKYLDELESEFQDQNKPQNECILDKEEEKIRSSKEIKEVIIENVEEIDDEIIECTIQENPFKEDVIDKIPVVEVKVIEELTISESVSTNKDDHNVDVSDEIDQKDTESVSSVERPKMLELNPSLLEEAPKREINLIGNPGSTPYNNVYISKELPSTTTQKDTSSQDESETSPSVSPTFSEASTETITDSTDSESEDEAKMVDPNIKKKDGVVTEDQNNSTPVNDVFSVPESCVETPTVNQNTSNPTEIDNTSSGGSEANVQPIESADNAILSAQNNQDTIVGFWLGKEAPLWIPDSDALSCLHCDARFTVIKRRHHCRACGLVLCSKCCNLKYRLEYLDAEARVCSKCYAILNMDTNSSSGSEISQTNSPNRQPNPNNPMEYCSVVPPMQQIDAAAQNPPTVMVPVGVLKRKGSAKGKSNKSVMFCDGIRPGSDLTKLDTDFNYSTQNSSGSSSKKTAQSISKVNHNVPTIDPTTKSFIPSDANFLPPTVTVFKSDITYVESMNGESIVETLKCEKLTFALQRNLHVDVKIINMDCCINRKAWCFSTEGLISVGQDEIVYLIELMENENTLPIDIFHHINSIYNDAVKGTTVTEMGISLHNTPNFLDFKNHAGFLYIRPTFQCLQNIIRPTEPYLIGLLIHRWETPWAKIFPLRLVLRLGAEYRYYPTPIISTRHRDSVFVEIGHTIMNLLADFRNFSYTLPNIRGLTIHMEDKNTTMTIPENRYDQVMKSLNHSTDHILAFGGNFSTIADSHLVCVQDTQASSENSYTTHAINILNKPRKVTGVSFIVFNGALKTSSGLTAKSTIVEDGLMIQIPPENMNALRESLRNMKNYTIQCGCINAPSDETVNIVWSEPDTNFNIGVTSPIDNQSMSGVPSIRVHNGKDFVCNSGNRLIRWTEVFILQNTDEHSKAKDPIDISKISESISKATCQALVKYLDLLTSNNFYKIGIRTTLHVENVSYSAGSNNIKLPPIYMKNLDNELIPVLHRITSNNLGDNAITLELIFRILNT